MSPTIVLISGANRGIGKGLLAKYLAREDHIVIAANRNPDHPTSRALENLPRGTGSRLIVVKVESNVESDAFEAVKQLEAQGIDHLDIVIANSGISQAWPTVADMKMSDLQSHIEVNVYGVIWLYQATAHLLRKSPHAIWVTMGSAAGSIVVRKHTEQLPVPNATYATSKIAVHWLTKKIDHEEESITAYVIHPGWTQTDTGKVTAAVFGFEEAPVKLEDSFNGVMDVIDTTFEKSRGGQLWNYDGTKMPW